MHNLLRMLTIACLLAAIVTAASYSGPVCGIIAGSAFLAAAYRIEAHSKIH